eukprot:CAMPEP_0119357698 /NCGR_PEP_ID=MMETSP1334-20130426/6044_1 /TAXON_ID=127549 /ORGANISM="Calcidiscus leptoporus, Strain RCC1130" /LENGTH=525 /DNA_ID=CAMNT_0007372005 /DNA_START=1 /DNA_END=1578 /DNA_ORIENTATION=+
MEVTKRRRSGLLVSGVICFCHITFLYSQFSGFWQVSDTEDLHGAGLLRIMLYAGEDEQFDTLATALRCKPVVGSAGPLKIDLDRSMCTALTCGQYQIEHSLFQFSYAYTIYDLWKTVRTRTPDGMLHATDLYTGPGACTMGGVCSEGSRLEHPGRLGAILLFLSSFLWPHVKLGLLHYFFHARIRPPTRRNGYYWLAFFGKWSFSDVLVMISLLGVLDLHVDRMKVDISNFAFSSVTASLSAQLRLEGQLAMYWFCLSVVLSLSVGVFIDQLDEREREQQQAPLRSAPDEAHGSRGGGRAGRSTCALAAAQALHTLLTVATLAVLLVALRAPLIRRIVSGSASAALRDFGVELNQSYSLLELGWLSARAGGCDYLMSGTFWVFVVVGPVLRSLSMLVLLVVPLPFNWQRSLHQASRHISVFYALEVMVVAVPLLNTTISELANGILTPKSFKLCTALNEQHGGPCLTIDVEPQAGYYLMCASVALYFVSGFDGSPTHKFIHRRFYPHDMPPPTCHDTASETFTMI